MVKPDRNNHRYVVGIDFGHGETSAAICPIEWDKPAGKRNLNKEDITLDRAAHKMILTSAICRVQNVTHIDDESFEHLTDNDGVRIGFKQKPESLEGEAENLMMEYMRTVYKRIRENRDELTDDNHIVYIARPSGWTDEKAKELYRKMAIKAGIPLGGLTSESRAAIFYAKLSPTINFARAIVQGAIVFDLGSSTLDITYLSDNDKPIDYGYDLGASIIDEAIFKNMILTNPTVSEFLTEYPPYRDALKFKARKFKEMAYGHPNIRTDESFPLRRIIKRNEASYDVYKNVYVELDIENIEELNSKIDEQTQYMERLRSALTDFKNEKIPEKVVNGVFLTGGASTMNFIPQLIAEVFNIELNQIKRDDNSTSLTVSRGIAMLGTADAITSVLIDELNGRLPDLINIKQMWVNFINTMTKDITDSLWNVVESACSYWVGKGKTTHKDELKQVVRMRVENFNSYNVTDVVNKTLQSFIKDSDGIITERLNEIIRQYAPDREIVPNGDAQLEDIDEILRALGNLPTTITEIDTTLLEDLLKMINEILLLPIIIIDILSSDENTRTRIANEFKRDAQKKLIEIRYTCSQNLMQNQTLQKTVSASLYNYFANLIVSNLEQVRIPIE